MKENQAKEIRTLVETRLGEIYATLTAGDPPKRIRKVFARAAKKVSSEIKAHLKDEAKREEKRKKAELKTLKKKQQKKTKTVKRPKAS